MSAPDRIGAWPKSNDPTSGGWDVRAAKVTQYLRADGPTITALLARIAASETRAEAAETALVAERAKTAKLVEAGRALQADLLERLRVLIGTDAIHGEEYRIVNAGRTAWADFCAAITEASQ